MNNYEEVLEKIVALLKTYAWIKRWQLLLPQYEDFQNYFSWEISILNPCVRESLLTHVWCLPILASFLHPYLEHKETTDLWKVLYMLSIHDIGETIVWDVIWLERSRSNKEQEDEYSAVKSLLTTEQFLIFEEFEKMETNEARFAKATDRLVCRIREYIDKPEIERERWSHFWATLWDMYKKWLPRMEWDSFLLGFFDYLRDKMQKQIFAS